MRTRYGTGWPIRSSVLHELRCTHADVRPTGLMKSGSQAREWCGLDTSNDPSLRRSGRFSALECLP